MHHICRRRSWPLPICLGFLWGSLGLTTSTWDDLFLESSICSLWDFVELVSRAMFCFRMMIIFRKECEGFLRLLRLSVLQVGWRIGFGCPFSWKTRTISVVSHSRTRASASWTRTCFGCPWDLLVSIGFETDIFVCFSGKGA